MIKVKIKENYHLVLVILVVGIFFTPVSKILAIGDSIDVSVPVSATCNNNNICAGQETSTNCPHDCPTTGGPTGGTTVFACNDGVDNDGDGLVDYLADPGCDSQTDNSEFNQIVVPPNPPDNPTTTPPVSPFDKFPKSPQESSFNWGDFQFIQDDEAIKFFSGDQTISVWGDKLLTVLLPYGKAPEVLKFIGVTLFDPNDNNKAFPFILRINDDKTAYVSTVDTLPAGLYPMKIHVVDYESRVVKVLDGYLEVKRHQPVVAVAGTASRLSDVAFGVGLLFAFLNVAFALAKAGSMVNLYLLLARLVGSLFRLLGLRKKKEPWGTVYDAITKRPLDPAYVTLMQNGVEVASSITDIDGRFGFFVKPGVYTIQASKTHYTFPSKKLADKTHDELFTDLYFGGPITLKDGEVVVCNIPMDPTSFDWNEFVKSKKNFFRLHNRHELIREYIFNTIFFIGLGLAIFEMIVAPSLLNLGLLALYLFLLSVQVVWVATHKVVTLKDLRSGEPMSFAIVKIFLPGSDQLIKKVVADELGRFYVLVPPGEYYLTVEEKLADETYALIYRSDSMNLKKGVLTKDITIA